MHIEKIKGNVGAQFTAPNGGNWVSSSGKPHHRVMTGADTSAVGTINRPLQRLRCAFCLLILLCLSATVFTSCDFSTASPTPTTSKHTLPTNNGPITYSTLPTDVLIRTFYGGGNFGTLAFSPEISVYGDGTYIIGPGLQMHQGKLDPNTLQQLLHTLVDTDGMLTLNRQVFYDIPDQNATFLQLMLNNKHYQFIYGKFGTLSESAQDMDEYHRLDQALTTITTSLTSATHLYTSKTMTILVHQDFSPDLTQTIPLWSLRDFTLDQLATFECGVIPADETGPNADTGCLTFTIPHYAYLPSTQQLQIIATLLNGNQQGEFFERGFYYKVMLRPLLPDELPQQTIAMLGSQQLTYTGVPLHTGTIPRPTPTP